MDAKICLNILKEIKDAAFATVDEFGNPQVRIIDIMIVEDEKLYFLTARGKDFYRQLEDFKKVAVTGLNSDWQMIRLNGKAQRLPDQKLWIDRMFQENPGMTSVYPGESRYILEPFVIENASMEFFDLSKEPIFRESFVIGNMAHISKGYVITEDCIGCGNCEEVCPQQAVKKSDVYEIIQEHCLHCGLCYETCPVDAIRKRS